MECSTDYTGRKYSLNIDFILNGIEVHSECDEGTRLIDLLRTKFNLTGAKKCCNLGKCGACSVILNGELVKSCLIPAFKAQGSEIKTIEGIFNTENYLDFINGFKEAGLHNCGICDSGKILAIETLLSVNQRPSKEEIYSALEGIICRCTSPSFLEKGIFSVIEHRRKRLHGTQG